MQCVKPLPWSTFCATQSSAFPDRRQLHSLAVLCAKPFLRCRLFGGMFLFFLLAVPQTEFFESRLKTGGKCETLSSRSHGLPHPLAPPRLIIIPGICHDGRANEQLLRRLLQLQRGKGCHGLTVVLFNGIVQMGVWICHMFDIIMLGLHSEKTSAYGLPTQ